MAEITLLSRMRLCYKRPWTRSETGLSTLSNGPDLSSSKLELAVMVVKVDNDAAADW